MKYLKYLLVLIATLVGAIIGLGVALGLFYLIGFSFIIWIDGTISLFLITGFAFGAYKLTKRYTQGINNGPI